MMSKETKTIDLMSKLATKFKSVKFGDEFLFINADCFDVLSEINDECIDFIFTDPPFMIDTNLKIARGSNMKFKGREVSFVWEWDRKWSSVGEYIRWCRKWFSECARVLKDYRHLVFFFDKAKASFMYYYSAKLGLKARQFLYYIKSNPFPPARCVGFASSVSMMMWFTKKEVKRDYFNWQEGISNDYFISSIVVNEKSEYGRVHPTQKPIDLLEWIIKYLSKPNDLVLDIFAGSFSTAIACYNLGRRFIGVEINDEYFEKGVERMKERIRQGDIFRNNFLSVEVFNGERL